MTSRTAWARRSRTTAISWPVFRALFASGVWGKPAERVDVLSFIRAKACLHRRRGASLYFVSLAASAMRRTPKLKSSSLT